MLTDPVFIVLVPSDLDIFSAFSMSSGPDAKEIEAVGG